MAFSTLAFNPLMARVAKSQAVTASRSTKLVVRAKASGAEPVTPVPVDKGFCYGLPGNTKPMENFDPAGFTKGKDEAGVRRLREAELMHCRVAMLASVGFPLAENFNPLFDGRIKGPALYHFQQMPTEFWAVLLAVLGLMEYRRAVKGWVNPTETQRQFLIKDDYELGGLGWDPLSLKPTDPEELRVMQTRELNNGRLAMFAIAGEIAQELATGKELFNLEDDGLLNDANCTEGIICDILEASA